MCYANILIKDKFKGEEKMRRQDREMDRVFGLNIIDNSEYGVLSMIDEKGEPYGLPLSLVRYGDLLYFHSAKLGKKVDALLENSKVSVAFVGAVKVPEIYTEAELEVMNIDPAEASKLISGVFTTEFESAIARGRVHLVEEEKEKIQAMRFICEKYTPTKMKYFDAAVNTSIAATNIYSIDIEEVTAKRKKYDAKGVEMKFGRMD